MLLPPEIFVVEFVVLIQQFQIVRQPFDRCEIYGVDVRFRRGESFVITVEINHDRDDVIVDIVKILFRDVIPAERILESDDGFVISAHHFSALFLLSTGATEVSTSAVYVDGDVLLKPVHVVLPPVTCLTVGCYPNREL